jgi:transcriptional regulator GlxA family with amidase domain
MNSQFSVQPSVLRSIDSSSPATAFERHYSVTELAELWCLSERTIRRIFNSEAGVLRWESSETRFKRGYTTLRIPESVVQRVHRKLRKAG